MDDESVAQADREQEAAEHESAQQEDVPAALVPKDKACPDSLTLYPSIAFT
jgi:hypothetical protein